MKIQRLRTLCLEIFKTLHQLNPCFMSNIFKAKTNDRPIRSRQYLNLKVVRANQVKFVEKSLRVLGPKIWNILPPHIKNAENLSAFKRLIKTWVGAFRVNAIYVEKSEYTYNTGLHMSKFYICTL